MNMPVDKDVTPATSIAENVEHHQQHYLNLPLWPKFDVYDGHLDGLIPSCRAESWEDFDRIVQYYCTNDVEGAYVFRGQKHYRWQLEPTLDRLTKGAIKEDIAVRQLESFRLATRGRLQEKSVLDDDNELWALGQHHGLATPLLDWSASPFVALFFAFEGGDDPTWKDEVGEPNNFSRTVFVLNKQFLRDLGREDVAFEFPQIVEPRIDDHGRLVNQAGLFTIAPYGETLESSLINALIESGVNTDDVDELAKYICRIHIPNQASARAACLQKLRKMNIHHASLFPDLIGASGYCNSLITDVINQLPSTSASERSREFESHEELIHSEADSTPETSTNQPIIGDRVDQLVGALGHNRQYNSKSTVEPLAKIAKRVIDFINHEAGVDWYHKDSVKARLRNIIRRELKRIHYQEDFIEVGTNALIDAATQMSLEYELLNSSPSLAENHNNSSLSPDHMTDTQTVGQGA
jgi:hypothetical protein